jgi:hypothetical protein
MIAKTTHNATVSLRRQVDARGGMPSVAGENDFDVKQFNVSQTLVIEQLPTDLRDRFTEMREMDLQVQSKS